MLKQRNTKEKGAGQMRKSFKKRQCVIVLASLSLAVCVVCVLAICRHMALWGGAKPSDDVQWMREFLKEEKFVVHAAGAMEADNHRYVYNNSKEALQNAISAGNHVIEVDFMLSSDGCYICGHDASEYPWIVGLAEPGPMDRETFLQQKLFGFQSPMDWDYVAEVMRDCDDIYIVADVKEENILSFYSMVRESYPDLTSRLIAQIYHADEISAIRDMGFKFIVFALYKTDQQEVLRMDMKPLQEDLTAFSFNQSYCNAKINRLSTWLAFRRMRNSGIPLINTIDDRATQAELFNKGISAICTNDTDNDAYRQRMS